MALAAHMQILKIRRRPTVLITQMQILKIRPTVLRFAGNGSLKV